MFTAALFTIAKIWKQSKHPSTDEWSMTKSTTNKKTTITDEWIEKMWYIYTM